MPKGNASTYTSLTDCVGPSGAPGKSRMWMRKRRSGTGTEQNNEERKGGKRQGEVENWRRKNFKKCENQPCINV